MREETQPEHTCVYCGEPITRKQYPCKGMPDGSKAHLECYIEHMRDDENETVH